MTSRILKFTIAPDSAQIIMLPKSAKVVMVAEQNHLVRFWIKSELDPQAQHLRRTFKLFATGDSIDTDQFAYRGTALCQGGELVWHLYEQVKEEVDGMAMLASLD